MPTTSKYPSVAYAIVFVNDATRTYTSDAVHRLRTYPPFLSDGTFGDLTGDDCGQQCGQEREESRRADKVHCDCCD